MHAGSLSGVCDFREIAHRPAASRPDAAADKRAAELKVAEQKCDAMASTAKDSCMADAKAKFGKM